MEIKRQYDHGKFGNFLFDFCAAWTKFIVKHRWLFYILVCTWGIIQTIIGILITIFMFYTWIFFKDFVKFKKYKWIYCIYTGQDYWGGFEMGIMFVRDKKSTEQYLNNHEFGHIIGQLWLGPFYMFTIGLHSATRYWVQTVREWRGKADKNPPYDQYWAEDAATQCGKYAAWYIDTYKKTK